MLPIYCPLVDFMHTEESRKYWHTEIVTTTLIIAHLNHLHFGRMPALHLTHNPIQ
ncbi:hypothetical protein SAMN05216302_10097 [Nitrosomonas aestuarii]|uniref:Uncharacterized protein n=1 Tax=Nitrosomonas aestuarii TaxID=52441 RepID=A0A1I4AF18_9PROT|nr:hypothetical protein SAMN05216302_10097 [Nitrosomonas aestuarii]